MQVITCCWKGLFLVGNKSGQEYLAMEDKTGANLKWKSCTMDGEEGFSYKLLVGPVGLEPTTKGFTLP